VDGPKCINQMKKIREDLIYDANRFVTNATTGNLFDSIFACDFGEYVFGVHEILELLCLESTTEILNV